MAIAKIVTKQEQVNYLRTFATKWDCCGEMKVGFSSRGEWFGKYLKPDEEQICHTCIHNREGYRVEFLRRTNEENKNYN